VARGVNYKFGGLFGFVVATILLAPTASFATPEEEENKTFEEPTALIPQDRGASVDCF